MDDNILFTLLHDVWGEGKTDSMRLAMLRLSADELRSDDADTLAQKVPQIPRDTWQAWRTYYSPKREAARCKLLQDMDVHVLLYTDNDYPICLKNVAKPPSLLYMKGHFQIAKLAIAMVGSRRATAYGQNVAYTLGKMLSQENVCVVSGLAKGIDAHSHAGALEGAGGTIAVLGCGIDKIYPRENAKLYDAITKHPHGAIISEWPLGAAANAWHFPARNRLIAGLADGLVVVEAAKKSGSLTTASYALEYGKEVFAVPGMITSAQSVGCHRLIKDGAKLVAQVNDILEEFGQQQLFKDEKTEKTTRAFSKDEQKVFDALTGVPQSVEEICQSCQLSVPVVNGILLEFELEDIVLQDYGRRYSKIKS